jgi:hypothetical protein
MSKLNSRDFVLLLVGSVILCSITVPWLASRRYRQMFSEFRFRSVLPHSPKIAVLIVSLVGVILLQIALIRPGPLGLLELVMLIASVGTLGVLVLLSYSLAFRRIEKRKTDKTD